MKKLIITILATIALAIIIPTAVFAEYKHGDMIEKINAYCDMSPEEQAEAIEKYSKYSHYYKSEDKTSKINEYCSLDEEGQKAMIAEHKEKFKKHTDVTKHGMTGMSGEYDASKHVGMTGMSGEYD
ncbi:MAG: hypothetical protein QQN41_10520, partial [Nitrosopumilus sp.]